MPRTAYLIIAFLFPLSIQGQQLPLETYTPANGLVDARVTKMFQDQKGRIYFLTREGFSIFDGQRFENYGATDNKRTEIFSDITEYKDGRVKIFSFDGNIYTVFNNKVTIDSSQKNNLHETNKVLDIGNDEKLIITNYNILRYKNNRFQKFNIKLNIPNYSGIENAVIFKEYLVFSSTININHRRIYLYNYETQQLTDSIDIGDISAFTSDKDKNIYFFADKWQQFNTDELANGKFKAEPLFFEQLIPKNMGSFNMQFDNEDNVWLINSEKGYCQLNYTKKNVTYFPFTKGILTGANFIFQDLEKNYWFVSSGNGVQKLQRSPLAKINTTDNISLGFVTNIGENETNDVYINSANGFFMAGKKISNPILPNTNSFYWQNQYWSFTDYKTLASNKGLQIHFEQLIENYLPQDFQTSYTTIDDEQRLIIAGKTLLLINTDYSVAAYKLPYFCDNIIPDKGNTYWCFLRSNYIIRLTLQNNKFTKTYSGFFENLNPRYTIKWDSNTFITGTRLDGIKILRWLNGTLKNTGSLDKRNGLSNNFINVLLKKGNNRLLAGTATGLDVLTFTEKDTLIENLSARNIVFSSFNNLVTLKDSSVLCSTLDGQLFKLENADNLSSNFLPVLTIKNISVNNKAINFLTEYSFSYNNNNFNYSVSAPSFLDNRNTRFQFILSGNGEYWKQNTTAADFQINNLLPGKYQLTVTVQYPGKFYPDQQLYYSFIITPPFWKKWWFSILIALLVTSIIFYAIRKYFQRLLEKQKILMEKELAIEQERTRMSRELHDGLGSMLSGIKHSFSAMNNQLDLSENQQQKFTNNIDKLNDSIKELRNISQSLASDSLLKFGLENSLKDYCRNISEPGVINISCTALDTDQMQLTEEQTFHIFRITQELLHNTIKHSEAGNAILQISYNAKKLYVTIEDDGKGFDMNTAKQKNTMGLKNIDTRIKILKGHIDYKTAAQKGTSVFIEIPCQEKKR